MKITRIGNHTLLESTNNVYLTQAQDMAFNERVFVTSVRVAHDDISFREATDEELAQWEEYKRKQEEEQKANE